MGAGEFAAGAGLAGLDPLNPASDSIYGKAPARAIGFDLVTRRFLFNTDGSAVDIHPVDQRVLFALGIERGALPSAPTVGNRFRVAMSRVAPSKIQKIAEDETKRALKVLLDAKDISLLSVTTDASFRGRVLIAVAYVNLRDPATNPNNPSVSARLVKLVA